MTVPRTEDTPAPAVPAELAEDITEDTVTDAVVESFAGAPDARLQELLGAFVRHLHAAVRETEPTMEEWEAAIDFLTRTGQMCNDVRQEFVLFSDVLGISALVENINHRKVAGATEATVLGPFHMTESPVRANGDSIDLVGGKTPCVVTGRVLTTDGTPIPGAQVDVWQADENGFYDVQVPDAQPAGNGRGLFTTDDEGRFWFTTVVPSYYPIPTDGPVGQLLDATRRHPNRPAHIHFIADAPGYTPVTTHIFVAGSPYLDSDAVFAVKKSLVRDFDPVDDPERAQRYGVANPFRLAEIDLVVQEQGVQVPAPEQAG
jgi:hydroxyquinol 1,2-dioxygenase